MSGLILARAYDPARGMCSVEHVKGDWFRLIPDRDPNNRALKMRSQVAWRKATTTH